MKTFHWNVFNIRFACKGNKGKAVLFAFPSKSCRFSHPFSPRAKSRAQGISPSADGDQGRCPWTSPAFLKNCWTKKLLLIQHSHRMNLYSFTYKPRYLLQKCLAVFVCPHCSYTGNLHKFLNTARLSAAHVTKGSV